MDVLLAGCGWLGRETARRLIARGDRVTGVTRTEESAAALRARGIEAVTFDLADPSASARLTGRYDGVMAMQSASGRGEAAYARAYVDATRALLASKAAENAAFVYVSSTGVFGQRDGGWVDEETAPDPSDATSSILLAAERLVLDKTSHRAAARIVRCSGLYGPGRVGTIERVRSGALALGPGDDTWMNFIHREDAADIVIAALDRGRPFATYHASDETPSRRRDVVAWIAARLGSPPPRREDGGDLPGRHASDRRVSAEATCRELGVRLAYPSFREGLARFLD
jgi:nucleoside-diphosphate-sugar epimerase